jgi:5-methylcytosine-specific restriction endonuclease McrA
MAKTTEKYQICNGCGKHRYITNRTKCLCDDCNYKRLHNGKSRFEVRAERSKAKKPKLRPATGELALFKEIWVERPHICTHCGKRLLEPLKPIYFSHIKSKGAYPELRLVKSNIELTCEDCHTKYEFGARSSVCKDE